MSEQYGGTDGPQRPLPPRPPAPPASNGVDSVGRDGRASEGQTQQLPDPAAPSAPTQPPTQAPSEHSGALPSGPPTGQSTYGSGYGQPPYGAPGYQPAQASAPRRFGAGTLVTGMLLAGLLGGGVAVGADALMDDGSAAQSSGQPRSVVVNNEDSVNAVTAAAVKASPSVVTIDVAASGSSGTGSGIILDDDGHILTNTHVVTLGGTAASPSIEVQDNQGRVFSATVVGTDPVSDLAVIKVDASDLTPATLGDSDELNVGDTVIAIGAPLGLAGTVTDGIVSTLNRTISVQSSAAPESETDGSGEDDGFGFRFAPPDGSSQNQTSAGSSIYLDVIQTDAAINHGNSGGALVNTSGDIIGVNVAIASASEESGSIGVGFAVPMSYAERVAEEIISNGSATHGFLGVSVTPASASDSSAFTVGAEVAENPAGGSPAAQAGLKQGDVITAVNGIPITDAQSLTAAIRMQAAGSKVTIDYDRGGSTESTDVTLGNSAAQ